MKVHCNEKCREIQLKLAIEDAHPRVVEYGLQTASQLTRVGVRDEGGAGRIVQSLHVPQRQAWGYPDVDYCHGWRTWSSVVIDVDTPAKINRVVHEQTSLLPNWIVYNRRNGHAHVCYPLASPVHEHPEASMDALDYLSDVERRLIAALDGDPAYPGALARNPITRPSWRTETLWFRKKPWYLDELKDAAAAALPEDWKPRRRVIGAVGRNVHLFQDLMAWAGREANRYESVVEQARLVNLSFETPLPQSEIKATAKSVAKYRGKWERRGWHSPRWIRRQSALGKISGKARNEKNADRDKAIIASYDEGRIQSDIAREHSLSRQRVNVIIRGGVK